MKTENNILVAFILNLFFSIIELIGGFITNSVSIISDALHDFGDSLSIGISYFLEKKSKKKPDEVYTYGYVKYSVMGSIITTVILLVSSIFVIYNAIGRLFNPEPINYNGMIAFACVGIVVNFLAAYFTKHGDSLNQKSVNLHMLEDVFGWIIVLIGSIIIRFTDFVIIDSILSIFLAVYIFVNALKNMKEVLDIFLEKVPNGISIEEIKKHILEIDDIIDVHHIHIRSIDGYNNYATLHVVVKKYDKKIKEKVKDMMKELNINHTTVEIEEEKEICINKTCKNDVANKTCHHHHH